MTDTPTGAYVPPQACTATLSRGHGVPLQCDERAGHGGPHSYVWWDDDQGATPHASDEQGASDV